MNGTQIASDIRWSIGCKNIFNAPKPIKKNHATLYRVPRIDDNGVIKKPCCHCNKVKPLADYTNNCHTKDGLAPACRECNRLRNQAARDRKREARIQEIRNAQQRSGAA